MPVPKDVTYSKLVHYSVNQLVCLEPSVCCQEQGGCPYGALGVLNSYWAGEDSTYKFIKVILTNPFHKGIR